MPEERKYYRLWVRFTNEDEWKNIGEYDSLDEAFSAIRALSNPEHDFLIDDFRIEVAVEAEPTPEEVKAIEESRRSGELIDLEEALKELKRRKRRKGKKGRRK